MEYEERIDSEQGTYIVASGRDFENILEKKTLVLQSGVIAPGQFTTLHGWFTRPVEFLGFIEQQAIFYLGKGDADLFNNGGFYYDVTYVFQPDRIGKSYKAGTFRDSFLRVNKKNEFCWK